MISNESSSVKRVGQRKKIAVIGTGASALYLLKNLLVSIDQLAPTIESIVVYERGNRAGMGMPYHPATTDRYNLCNISSEELPNLQQTFADWLRHLPEHKLEYFGLERESISETETYLRLAVGEYFESQFHAVVEQLVGRGVRVEVKLTSQVTDMHDDASRERVTVYCGSRKEEFDRVVIATGHAFDESDQPQDGYYASPWPIQKLFPRTGQSVNRTVGTLGASLSAFDVVTSLAHRSGRFERSGDWLRFIRNADASEFRIIMHSANGRLPHLQYLQCRPFREVYRYISREQMLALRDAKGQIRLNDFFDRVCRPVLIKALGEDHRDDLSARLRDSHFSIESLVEALSKEHEYADPFAGMRKEFEHARDLHNDGQPVHWKEALDDLIYTLSYHADLLTAEDHLTLKNVVLPFLNSVIAAMPLISAEILLALRDADAIDLIAGEAEVKEKQAGRTIVEVTGEDGAKRTIAYSMFIDCTGQSGLDLKTFPFQTLVQSGTVRSARVSYSESASDRKSLELPGIEIDAAFRVIGKDDQPNPRIFDIAFPHVTGLRPYSYGLQACNHSAGLVVEAWKVELQTGQDPPNSTESLTRLHDRVANE